jgi:hypothetical protein
MNKFIKSEYIEHYFNGTVNFGRRLTCEITPNGIGIDNTVLKIILPVLPEGLIYKKDCVYHLIKSIQIDIGKQHSYQDYLHTYIKYNSKQLELIDKVNGLYEKKLKCFSRESNTVYYPFDLGDIFGKSKIIIKDSEGLLNANFRGLRLCDMGMTEIYFHCEFGNLIDLVELTEEDLLELTKEEMSEDFIKDFIKDFLGKFNPEDLSIVNGSLAVCHTLSDLVLDSQVNHAMTYRKTEFEQEMVSWVMRSVKIDRTDQNTQKLELQFGNDVELVSDMILFTDVSGKTFDSYELSINGNTCYHQNVNSVMETMYKYNRSELDADLHCSQIDINNANRIDKLFLNIHFGKCDPIDFELFCLFRICSKFRHSQFKDFYGRGYELGLEIVSVKES